MSHDTAFYNQTKISKAENDPEESLVKQVLPGALGSPDQAGDVR